MRVPDRQIPERLLMPKRGFDDRDQVDPTRRKPALTFQVPDQPVRGTQFMCVLHLRQNNPVQPRPHHRDDVAVAPFRRSAH